MGYGVLLLSAILLGGCEGVAVHDVSSLLVPEFQRSEVIGFVAGLGTTFAAVPDLLGMFKRRSSKGINPTMAGIIGVFQIVWIYYGLLIASRPVIAWNMIGVVINLLTVGAYVRFRPPRESSHGVNTCFPGEAGIGPAHALCNIPNVVSGTATRPTSSACRRT